MAANDPESRSPGRSVEERLKLQYAVTNVLSEAAGLASAAPELLDAIFRHTAWDLGVFWVPSQEDGSGEMVCLHAGFRPARGFPEAFGEADDTGGSATSRRRPAFPARRLRPARGS